MEVEVEMTGTEEAPLRGAEKTTTEDLHLGDEEDIMMTAGEEDMGDEDGEVVVMVGITGMMKTMEAAMTMVMAPGEKTRRTSFQIILNTFYLKMILWPQEHCLLEIWSSTSHWRR